MNDSIKDRAVINIKRSGWRAYALIFMMAITYLVFGSLVTLNVALFEIVDYFVKKPEVIGYFKDEISEEDILKVKTEIEGYDYVAGVRYVSKEDAMATFIKENEGDEEILEAVTANVLPAHLNVKVKSLDKIADITNYFQGTQKVDEISDYSDMIPGLKKIVLALRVSGWALMSVFTIATVFIIFLTVGLTVYSQKSEIIIMKLVGATNWYVRAPYLLESVVYSFVASLVSLTVLIPLQYFQYHKLLNSLFGSGDIIKPLGFTALISISLANLLFAMALSILSSFFASKRYIGR